MRIINTGTRVRCHCECHTDQLGRVYRFDAERASAAIILDDGDEVYLPVSHFDEVEEPV